MQLFVRNRRPTASLSTPLYLSVSAIREPSLGDSVAPRTSADFGLLMKSDVEKWAGVIQSANIKLEQ